MSMDIPNHAVKLGEPRAPLAHLRGGELRTFSQSHPRGNPTGSLNKFLKSPVVLSTHDGVQYQAMTLIDNGAEVSIPLISRC